MKLIPKLILLREQQSLWTLGECTFLKICIGYLCTCRTVCVHDCRFSPENAQLQLLRGVQFHSFFSAAKHGTRRVVSYHVIPANPSVELSVRECIQCCSTLGELLTKLSYCFPEVGQHLLRLISISPPKM